MRRSRTGVVRRADGLCLYCLHVLQHPTHKFCNQSCITAWTNKRRTIPLEARFWMQVDKTEGCWLWRGSTRPNGYGRLQIVESRSAPGVHRISYELHYGPIPDGLFVCHRCDTPLCVNPEHLFLGSQADNMHDRQRKGKYYSGREWYQRMDPRRNRHV